MSLGIRILFTVVRHSSYERLGSIRPPKGTPDSHLPFCTHLGLVLFFFPQHNLNCYWPLAISLSLSLPLPFPLPLSLPSIHTGKDISLLHIYCAMCIDLFLWFHLLKGGKKNVLRASGYGSLFINRHDSSLLYDICT